MTLDSNILIAYLSGEPATIAAVNRWIADGLDLRISSIAVTETLALPTLTPQDEERILGFLNNFTRVPFDDRLAQTAAMLIRVYRLKLPDAAIAATAMDGDGRLVSRDHVFRRVNEITLVEI